MYLTVIDTMQKYWVYAVKDSKKCEKLENWRRFKKFTWKNSLQFCKCIFYVHKKSTNFAAWSDLGGFPLHSEIVRLLIRRWYNLKICLQNFLFLWMQMNEVRIFFLILTKIKKKSEHQRWSNWLVIWKHKFKSVCLKTFTY